MPVARLGLLCRFSQCEGGWLPGGVNFAIGIDKTRGLLGIHSSVGDW